MCRNYESGTSRRCISVEFQGLKDAASADGTMDGFSAIYYLGAWRRDPRLYQRTAISAVAFNFDVHRVDKDGDFAIHTSNLLDFSNCDKWKPVTFVRALAGLLSFAATQASGIGNRGAYCCRVVELFEAGTLTRGKILPWVYRALRRGLQNGPP